MAQFHILNIIALLAYLTLSITGHVYGHVSIALYSALILIAWVTYIFIYRTSTTFDKSRFPWITIACYAGAIRIIALLSSPIYEDDFYRYLLDGWMSFEYGNPYAYTPASFFGLQTVPATLQSILSNINNPDLPTIYGPISQLIFFLSYLVFPGKLLGIKLFFLLFDIGTIFLLRRLVEPAKVILYIFCPLLIKEVCFTAHHDIIGIFFVVAALYALKHHGGKATGSFLALACGVKALGFILIPIFWLRLIRAEQVKFILFCVIIYAPLLLIDGNAGIPTLITFMNEWEYNSSGYAVLSLLGNNQIANLFACFALLSTYYVLTTSGWHKRILSPRGDILLGIFFLVTSVLNPWYLLWLLPFIVVYPSYTGLTAILMVNLSYWHGLNLPAYNLWAYDHPDWVRPIEFGVIGIVFVWEYLVSNWKHSVKPTLHEVKN